jgi:predicted nuclease of predicted toxin-antitoxin system
MQFLADQDVYATTVDWLRSHGHNVEAARSLGMQEATDRQLLRRASQLNRIMVTRDKDFRALVFLLGVGSTGVILLRMSPSTVDAVHATLKALITSRSSSDFQHTFCVVEPDRYRIRTISAG